MGQKKRNSIVCLLILLLILAAAYFALQSWNKSKEETKQALAEAEQIYITDIDKITGVQYDMGSGKMAFQKKKDTWYYAPDMDFPLAQSYPQQIAKDFSHLKAERELKDGDSLKDYGLEDPAYTVVLTDSDGEETTLYYGGAVGDSYYVTVGDTGRVYTVSSTSVSELPASLEEVAQLDTYPVIGSGNLEKVTIMKDGQTTTYDSENDENSKDIAAAAGGLGAVTLEKAADYSAEDQDLAGYGLDEESRITVEAVYTSNKKEKTLTLYIGKKDDDGNRYVMMNDSRIVYLISDEVCQNILNEK